MGRRYTSRMLDFSKGVVGGISDYGRRPRHLRVAENVLMRPFGAVQVRLGSQRLCSATLTKKPHSLMEWVSTAGATQLYVGCDDTAGILYRMTGSALTSQTTPYALASTSKMSWAQLNGALWVTENAGANEPMFYRSSNAANTFLSGHLPQPGFPATTTGAAITGAGIPAATTLNGSIAEGAVTLTLSANATASATVTLVIGGKSVPNCTTTAASPTVTYNVATAAAGAQMTLTGAAGGSMTAAITYYYRPRYRYTDGSSRAGTPVSIAMGANTAVNITNMVNEIRSDYTGWTLERTKQGGTAAGPFYFVADAATATTTTYADTLADADLGYRAEENLHGTPPHMDGLIAFRDRLFGWAGSLLYASQATGDAEATGIANWQALNAYEFGTDDGDSIQCVVVQGDRLLIFKKWSVWALEGFDPQSFAEVPVYRGAGAAGPRCADSMGSTAWFFGDAGFHLIRGNAIEPFGWVEVGHLFDLFVKGKYADVVVKNYLGQHVLIAFSSGGTRNDDMLLYDQRFGAWTRITNWYAQDILVQKAAGFGSAQAIVFADQRDRDATAGFDYRVWLGFYGYKDEKAADGTSGSAVTVQLVTPYIDDGSPDVWKDFERLELYAASNGITMAVVLTLDPDGLAQSISLPLPQSGATWGGSTLWGAFNWATAQETSAAFGLAEGSTGRRYSLRFTAACTADFQFKGYALDAILQPERRYS